MKKEVYYVTPRTGENGNEWVITLENGGKVVEVFKTKAEAMKRAKELSDRYDRDLKEQLRQGSRKGMVK